jgi:hypothetical protein
VFAADLHRGSAKTIGRKDAGNTGALIQQKNDQVLSSGFADTGFGNTDPDSGYWKHG